MIELIARALIASTWIGLVVALAGIAASRAFAGARSRYAILFLTLNLVPLGSIVYAWFASTPAADFPSTGRCDWMVNLWTVGAAVMALRAVVSWLWLTRMLRRTLQPATELLTSFEKVARCLGFSKAPGLRITEARLSPCTVGVLRSVVVLPLSVVSRLSTEQVEAVLAHELAHIRRWDYWANVVQLTIESLLFFHPAVWVLSHMVTIERELCCDDIAARVVGDRRLYARSLAAVATGGRTPLAPAATTAIHYRLRRLVSPGSVSDPAVGRGSAFALAVCVALAAAAFTKEPPRLVFVRQDLPASWTANARLQRPNGLIEIDFRTHQGDAKVLLTQPTAGHPKTWFTLNDGVESIRYEASRHPNGQIVFRRTH